jgi:hypothetical protein
MKNRVDHHLLRLKAYDKTKRAEKEKEGKMKAFDYIYTKLSSLGLTRGTRLKHEVL